MRLVQMSILIIVVAVLAVLAGMLAWPARQGGGEGLAFSRVPRIAENMLPPLETYRGRDGAELTFRFYPSDSDRVLILVHGSGYHGAYLHPPAAALADSGSANVATPNIRGHHASGPVRGDIGHIGQLEDDLAALMETLRTRVADARFVLGGHSSGGGFALRMAAGGMNGQIDGLVLLAPYLGHDAPTTRGNSGGWANPDLPRIIALSMLNGVGLTALNGLTSLTFNMPERARDGTETLAYSYRLMTAFGPSRAVTQDIAALGVPTLVIAGARDEAMMADAYKDVFAGQPDAEVAVVEEAGHLDIVANVEALERIEAFLAELNR